MLRRKFAQSLQSRRVAGLPSGLPATGLVTVQKITVSIITVSIITVAAMMVLWVPGTAWAASPASAPASQFVKFQLNGTVSDEEGGALAGVRVLAIDESTGMRRSAVTSSDGLFTISDLPPGSYNVSFELEGFESHEEFDVQVQADTGLLDIILEPEDGDC